jgi:hypothetical protein
MLQFGTTQEKIFDLQTVEQGGDWDAKLENIQPVGGSTWMHRAMQQALIQVWQPAIDKDLSEGVYNRERITILITDGEPTQFQDPCIAPNENPKISYSAQNITIYPIVFSTNNVKLDSILCMVDPFRGYLIAPGGDDPSDYERALNKTFDNFELCDNITSSITPYNGGYTRTGKIWEGKPTYIHSEGWEARYNGPAEGWLFHAPKDISKGIMSEIDPSNKLYPEDKPRHDYEVEERNLITNISTYYTIPRVLICCVKTAIPTRVPSVPPTSPPSSEQPTVSPTLHPSTTCPTTQEPTYFPTSEVPTKSPTRHPTTEEPTGHPTSEVPTKSPTRHPSTEIPTNPP